MQNFTEYGPSIKILDIKNIETLTNYKFPEKYTEFLLKFNGGRPDQDMFRIADRPEDDIGLVQVFFGIERPSDTSNIAWNFNVFAGRIPNNLIPIGREDTGNLLCLNRLDDSVYYWDHDKEGAIPENCTYKLSENWEVFLNNLFLE